MEHSDSIINNISNNTEVILESPKGGFAASDRREMTRLSSGGYKLA